VIRRPDTKADHTLPEAIRLRCLDLREADPPAGVEPLHWRLLTTHAIADAAAAWQIVGWYQMRRVIEQLHRVMKSQGLQLEDSQLATADRLEKLAAAADWCGTSPIDRLAGGLEHLVHQLGFP
jgi:hypothetical protein